MSKFKVTDRVTIANPPKDDGFGIPADYWGQTGTVAELPCKDCGYGVMCPYEVGFNPPPGNAIEPYILVEEHNLEAASGK